MAAFIETIFNQGSDAFASQYALSFPTGVPGTPVIDPGVIVRLDKSFQIPTTTTYQYENWYRGLKVQRTGPKDETDKVIKLDFRLDQNWDIYQIFDRWYNLCFNDTEGNMGSEQSTRASIVFTAFGPGGNNNVPAKQFVIKYCKPKNIRLGSAFSHESGDPQRVELELIYLFYEDISFPVSNT